MKQIIELLVFAYENALYVFLFSVALLTLDYFTSTSSSSLSQSLATSRPTITILFVASLSALICKGVIEASWYIKAKSHFGSLAEREERLISAMAVVGDSTIHLNATNAIAKGLAEKGFFPKPRENEAATTGRFAFTFRSRIWKVVLEKYGTSMDEKEAENWLDYFDQSDRHEERSA